MIFYFRIAVAFLVFSLVGFPATGQEKTKFYVGASSKTLGYSPLWVGVKKGFFDQQGLDAQLLLLRGTTMTVQAIAGASLNVGSGNPEAFIEASERGLDLVMIGGVINGLTHFIMAGKKYKTYEDLRGATFGSSSLTSGTVTALKQALKAKGSNTRATIKYL
jgi:NitT/TauT family transport system substrate-binding protein